jgi:hypothetical protein
LIVPGSIRVTFNSGWLGIPGTDLLKLNANDTTSGVLDVSVTRINQLAISGSGNIGEVSFVMEDNIAGKMNGDFSTVLSLCIEQPLAINASGETIPVSIACDSVIATQVIDQIEDQHLQQMILSPNPADHFVEIFLQQPCTGNVRLVNIFGQLIEEQVIHSKYITFNTEQIPSGTYFIILKNEKTIQSSKVIIQH